MHHDEDTDRIPQRECSPATIPAHNSDYVNVPITDAGRGALKPGDNVIAAHTHNTTGGQGIDIGITEVAH